MALRAEEFSLMVRRTSGWKVFPERAKSAGPTVAPTNGPLREPCRLPGGLAAPWGRVGSPEKEHGSVALSRHGQQCLNPTVQPVLYRNTGLFVPEEDLLHTWQVRHAA